MKGYEILYIINKDIGQDGIKAVAEKMTSIISETNGKLLASQDLGVRELAETFENYNQGHFIQLQFEGTNATLDELNRHVRITESIIRHLIVELDSVMPLKKQATES